MGIQHYWDHVVLSLYGLTAMTFILGGLLTQYEGKVGTAAALVAAGLLLTSLVATSVGIVWWGLS